MQLSFKRVIGITSITTFVGLLIICGLLYYLFIGSIRSSAPYQLSLQHLTHNEILNQVIGKVVEVGPFPTGKIDDERAEVFLSVKGELERAKLKFIYKKSGPEWLVTEAYALLPDNTEPIPILPLTVSSMVFYKHSATGPLNPKREYVLGETIYWTVLVENIYRKDGQAHVTEGLKVFNEKGEVVIENSDLYTVNEPISSNRLAFDNFLNLSGPGIYKIEISITDRGSERALMESTEVTIVPAKELHIASFTFNRESSDGPVNESGVYPLGEKVYLNFQVTGFQAKENLISVSEDLFVYNSADGAVIEYPGILEVKDTWDNNEILYINNDLQLDQPGNYRVKIVMHDHNSDTSQSFTEKLTILEPAN